MRVRDMADRLGESKPLVRAFSVRFQLRAGPPLSSYFAIDSSLASHFRPEPAENDHLAVSDEKMGHAKKGREVWCPRGHHPASALEALLSTHCVRLRKGRSEHLMRLPPDATARPAKRFRDVCFNDDLLECVNLVISRSMVFIYRLGVKSSVERISTFSFPMSSSKSNPRPSSSMGSITIFLGRANGPSGAAVGDLASTTKTLRKGTDTAMMVTADSTVPQIRMPLSLSGNLTVSLRTILGHKLCANVLKADLQVESGLVRRCS